MSKNLSVELVEPDDWTSDDAFTKLRVHYNAYQSAGVELSRDDLQSIVQQAADKYGVVADREDQ